MSIPELLYTYHFVLSVERARKQQIHTVPRPWFLMPFSDRRNQSSLQKCLSPGLDRETARMSPEHPVALERMEVLEKMRPTMVGHRDTGAN